jgi:quercetin dioxygenase-like cupin family protein
MVNKLISKARANFEMVRLSSGSKVSNIEIDSIPEKREKFLDTNDEWQIVNLPNSTNSGACMFYAKKGNYFPPHKHNDASEQIIILNPKGKIKVVTYNEIKIYEYPQAVFIKKNVPHAVVWMEDTDALIIWNPKFDKGWEADVNDDSPIKN